MNLSEYRHHFKSQLDGKYPAEEVISFFNWLCESYLNLKRAEIPLELKRIFTEEEHSLFDIALHQLEKDVPIQYILGETEFYGMKFKVSRGVLIPRPETEELVDLIIKQAPKGKISILDIGTGSGCIAVSLAKNLAEAQVTAFDISGAALEIALQNALQNQVNVTFIKKDILKTETLDQNWDVIVSNPPYVLNSEKEKMQANVLEHEPHTALFVPDINPLLFYSKIARLAQNHLTPNGKLYFEINEAYGKEVVKLLEMLDYKNVKLKKDFFGKDRMVSAVNPD
jgi:release factor glutamine methyltransferase